MLVTKASTSKSGEQLATYNLTLTKIATEGNTVVWDHREYSKITDWKVPAGTYSLEVENLTIAEAAEANDGNGAVRVLGTTANFTVEAGKATDVSVNCTPQNSRLSFAADAAFNSVFSSPTVSVTEPRTVNLGTPKLTHAASTSAYFEPCEVSWTLTATTALANTEKTFNGTVDLQTAKWRQVNFTTTNTDGAINITVSVDGEITAVVPVNVTIDPTPSAE